MQFFQMKKDCKVVKVSWGISFVTTELCEGANIEDSLFPIGKIALDEAILVMEKRLINPNPAGYFYLEDYLKDMGLQHGHLQTDEYWFLFDCEELTYEDIDNMITVYGLLGDATDQFLGYWLVTDSYEKFFSSVLDLPVEYYIRGQANNKTGVYQRTIVK